MTCIDNGTAVQLVLAGDFGAQFYNLSLKGSEDADISNGYKLIDESSTMF